MSFLSYNTAGPFATAGRLLAQLACGYYFVIVASSGLSDSMGFSDRQENQLHAMNIADLVLLWDLLRRLTDIVLADGYRRSVGDVVEKWSADQFSLFLHACSLFNLQALDDATLDILPKGVTMSIVRFLRFPEIAKSPLGVEDVSLDVAKQAAYQFAYVSAMYCAQELLLPAIPYPLPAWLGARTLLCISFGAVALRGMFRRKAVPKEAAKPAEGDPPPQEDEPATAEELDQICKEMIKKVKLLQGVMREQPEEFLEDIMSMLKHETYLPGSHLATLGEVGHHMFFLAKGNIMVHTANNKQFKLPSGIALGEIALMRPMSKRTATLTAHNKCEVFLLNQEAFDRLRSGYPALAQDVRQMVSGYLRNDSALYVTICMRASARICYIVGGCFFAAMYVLIFIARH